MELNMADVLLGGVPFDYKLSSIRLQLKDGSIDIGPPRPRGSNGEDDDGVANLILQVYNEYAEEVEIEYQPAAKQEDTRWGFWCDGLTLKIVIPYKFWKTYWYPDLSAEGHLSLHDVIRGSSATAASSARAICCVTEYSNGSSKEQPLLLPHRSSSSIMEGIHICQCRSRSSGNSSNYGQPQEGAKQGSRAMQAGELVRSASTQADTTTVIKVRCQRPAGSPAGSEVFERAIKVRCSRPVSPMQVAEPETKMRSSTPVSPLPVCEPATKTRQLSSTEASSERSVESRCTTPSSTAETLARAEEALARVQQSSKGVTSTRPASSVDSYDRSSESRCSTPGFPTKALARAKEALARVQDVRPSIRPPSTPKGRVPSRSKANTELCVRATAIATSPLYLLPPKKRGISPDTTKLTKCFSGDTADLINTSSRGTSNDSDLGQQRDPVVVAQAPMKGSQNPNITNLANCFSGNTTNLINTSSRGTSHDFDLSQQRDPIVVGQVLLKDSQKLDIREVWKAAFDKFISKETVRSLLEHGKKSAAFLKERIELIYKEKAATLTQGKRYFTAKRKELALAKLECIFCLRVIPSTEDPEGIKNWNSFNDVTTWKNSRVYSHQNSSSLVTTGTNTVTSSLRIEACKLELRNFHIEGQL